MTSGKSGMIQVETGTASITTITRAKSGNLLVVSEKSISIFYETNFFYILLTIFRLLHNNSLKNMDKIFYYFDYIFCIFLYQIYIYIY